MSQNPAQPTPGPQWSHPQDQPPYPPAPSPSAGAQPYPPRQPDYRTPSYGAAPGAVSQDDRNLAVLAHLSPFIAAWLVVSPLGPLVVYLIYRDSRPFVRANAVEALNFNLTMWIGLAISVPLMLVLVGFLTAPLFGLAMLVFHIIGAVRAKDGEVYRYPLSVRFFS